MVKVYPNGEEFIKENDAILKQNRYMSAFFYWDAPFITESNQVNYALRVAQGESVLLGMKVEPFNLLLYGNSECLEELLAFIKDNGYELTGILTSQSIGDALLDISPRVLGKEYYQQIGMDFMTATEISEPSSDEVEIPTLNDVDEIYHLMINFIKDCGLTDEVHKEKIGERISDYRIIRRDDKIVSLSRRSPDTDTSIRISAVYSRPEYRNQKLARKVVNYLKNEIINEGKIATLNVDQANPISYHLYSSLGFKKVFSQGIFLLKQ